jgi:hypothetical protein
VALLVGIAVGAACRNPQTRPPKESRRVNQTVAQSVASSGLQLRLRGEAGAVVVSLHNVGTSPLRVWSHVDAGIHHYDWYTLEVVAPDGKARTLILSDDRNESARISADLAPGASIEHAIDLVAWAKRAPNGGVPLPPATYQVSATYAVTEPADFWRGSLRAGPVPVQVD